MLDSLFRFLGRSGRPAARVKSKKTSVVPHLEALEQRWVLSTANGMSTQALLGSAIGGLTGTPPAGIVQTTNTGVTAPSVNNGAAQTPTVNAPSSAATTQTQEVDATFAAFSTGGSATQTVAQFNPS